MSAKLFYRTASECGIREAAAFARECGVPLAVVQIWLRLLHRQTIASYINK